MNQERPPAYAGTFYPENPDLLTSVVKTLLDSPALKESDGFDSDTLRALVVPHGEFSRTGPIAGNAFRLLGKRKNIPKRVAIVGPFHIWTEFGLVLPSATSFRIPTGSFPVDRTSIHSLAFAAETLFSDEAHLQEFSIETQLPFLMEIWGSIPIIPLGISDITADRLAHILDPLFDDPDTFLIFTADFSRHIDTEETVSNGQDSFSKFLSCEPLDPTQVCGATGLNALTLLARERGLTPQLLCAADPSTMRGDLPQTARQASFGFYR